MVLGMELSKDFYGFLWFSNLGFSYEYILTLSLI